MVRANVVLEAGQRVRVVQQIPQRARTWTTSVEGRVVRFQHARTGSWYAHARGNRLWLDRLTLRKDDGEIVVINLDGYSHVERVGTPSDKLQVNQTGEADTLSDAATDGEAR